MSGDRNQVLLVATEHLPADEVLRLERESSDQRVTLLLFAANADQHAYPANWSVVKASEFFSVDDVRRDFLAFLDAWPRTPCFQGRSFDELFRRRGGYSLWWTGRDEDRHPTETIFPKLCVLWACDRAMVQDKPAKVYILTRQVEVAILLESRCRRKDANPVF